MNVCTAVALRINDLLIKNNMTLYRLEQESCILHGTMMQIMHGNNKNVTLKTIMQIAEGFHMGVWEFLDDDLFRRDDLEIY